MRKSIWILLVIPALLVSCSENDSPTGGSAALSPEALVQQYIDAHSDDLGLRQGTDELRHEYTVPMPDGRYRVVFQQYYRNVHVEPAQFTAIVWPNDSLSNIYADLYAGIDIWPRPRLTDRQAAVAAKRHAIEFEMDNADQFPPRLEVWEIYGQYRLCWTVVFSLYDGWRSRQLTLMVDARDGSLAGWWEFILD